MWRKYFNLVGVLPGKIVTRGNKIVDFSSDDLPVALVQKLFEEDFPYLTVTQQGKSELYGIKPKKSPRKKYRSKKM